MPRIDGKAARTLLLLLAGAVVLFGFTPISDALLGLVNGSFAPTPFTSLALQNPSTATIGVKPGVTLPVELTNRTGKARSYEWQAVQGDSVVSHGRTTLANGRTTTIFVSTSHAMLGKLRVSVLGTAIFVTVPILKS